MKKTLLMTLLAGLVSASQLVQATEVFITGSTAFRKNVHDACLKMFNPGGSVAFAEIDDTNSILGQGSGSGNGAYAWVMSGTPTNSLGLITDTLVIHASFTGSLQGSFAVQQGTEIEWLGTNAGGTTLVTNSATIAFSDVFTSSSLWTALPSNYQEDTVGIQPFAFVKSQSSGAGQTTMNNITNVSWEQVKGLYEDGELPLSFWTGLDSDTNTPIYLVNRTLDSGTRRTIGAETDHKWLFNAPVYMFNTGTNAGNFTWAKYFTTDSANTNNVVGPAGYGNVNYANSIFSWGPGCVGGGDLRGVLNGTSVNNTSIGYLSFSDAQSAWSGTTWLGLLTFEGGLPTAALPSNASATNANDFTPVIEGKYPYWAEEVVFFPTTQTQLNQAGDQKITQPQLGSKGSGLASGTFLGLLDYQGGGTNFVGGSVENEIVNSKPNTNIPLYKMRVNHNNLTSLITPGHY
jgi:ABC-type phosphate transport system substrate-binding protein